MSIQATENFMPILYYTPPPTRVVFDEKYSHDGFRQRAPGPVSLGNDRLVAEPKSTQLMVYELTNRIGKKLVAYIAGITQRGTVDSWIAGRKSVPRGTRERLRFAHSLIDQLLLTDAPSVAQAWLTGVNPALGDKAPIAILRDSNLSVEGERILAAARRFSDHG